MTPRSAALSIALLVTLSGTRAAAQERFEAAIGLWIPRADIIISSDGPGAPGTPIDLRQEAGLTDSHFPVVSGAWRVAPRHRIRIEYVPISYESSATLSRDVNFTGAAFPKGTAVNSTLDWKSYAAGYEYEFVLRRRWSAGILVAARQTDIQERLSSASVTQVRRTRVPVPLVGGSLHLNPADRVSLAFECTGFKVPNSADRHYGGHYLDAEVRGTFDVMPGPARAGHYTAGVQAGYRVVDIFHLGESDSATMTVKGVYVGVVVRR
jgi:hypothetical protein